MNYWQGNLVILRGVEPEDAELFHRWNQDSERGRNLEFVWPPVSLANVRGWATKQSEQRMEDGSFHWVIETLAHEPVGGIATHDCEPRNGTFSYGIDIAQEHRRHGYAREAVHLVLRYYFEELRYQKATVGIHDDNEASKQLHERLGFQEEGRLRRMIYTQGRFVDMLWYGMTGEEFHDRDR